MPLTIGDLFIVFAAVFGGIGLQIWLSTRKQIWYGLLLPVISIGYSLYLVPKVSFYEELNTQFKIGMYLQQNMLTIGLLIIFGICQWRRYAKKNQ
ncbi:hypothetical protein IV487_11510 [Enterococcus saccharolyticus]|uniref:hypothetical protein n=1 Tax=Enterococcus saccharolyticus TaxID=41997 RepID=UPI001E4C5E59|nr:hypothetical protein [Enterococcus saccharolyticus]MCD5003091.1 hypothetical protein [Enterococcus saccharolyticus]